MPDLIYHAAILAVLAWGLIVTMRTGLVRFLTVRTRLALDFAFIGS